MPTILFAEDDLAIRDLLMFLLDTSGYRVLACADGASALATARRERPDLAILDASMPGIDGIDVCRALRGAAGTRLMPVLILTPHGRRPGTGAEDYLVKPFGPGELMSHIETLLDHSRAAAPIASS